MPEKDAVRTKIERSKMLTLVSIVAGIGALALALLIIFPGIIYEWAGLDIYSLALIPYCMTIIFAVAAAIYGILSSRAAHEEEEKKLLVDRKEIESAFDVNEDVRFTAGRSFENFKKYAPPVMSIVGALFMGLVLFLFWRSWGARISPPAPVSSLHAAFVSAIYMCLSVFAGAFCIGQSREKDFRWLRPVGAWLVMGFVVTFLTMLAALMNKFEYPQTDYYMRNIVFVFYIILGVEFIINFISEFYRPRTLEEERPVFESRLLALFTEPGGVVRNIADTLDYQFGFKVSRTWIYSFVEKSLVPLLIVWLLTLWLFTCLTEVKHNEIGIRERFGKILSKEALPPGVYFKFPWPFGQITRFPGDKIQEIILGISKNGKEAKNMPSILLWTKDHGTERTFLVASETSSPESGAPVSFLNVSVPIQFKMRPGRIFDYAYRNADARKILTDISEAAVTQYFASVDMLKVMSTDRQKTGEELRKIIQKAANKDNLGIDVLYVNLHGVHPPVDKVAPAFQDVIGAREEKNTLVLIAKAYESAILPAAEAEGIALQSQAEAYKNDKVTVAKAESERFKEQLKAYLQMPRMFRLRTYLDFLENDCKDIRKYILSAEFPCEIYEINLEQKTRLDLLDADLGDIQSGK